MTEEELRESEECAWVCDELPYAPGVERWGTNCGFEVFIFAQGEQFYFCPHCGRKLEE